MELTPFYLKNTINLIAAQALNTAARGIFTSKNASFESFSPFLSVLLGKGGV
jgi:hypothetical protein